MDKWRKIILLTTILLLIGIFIGYRIIVNDPSDNTTKPKFVLLDQTNTSFYLQINSLENEELQLSNLYYITTDGVKPHTLLDPVNITIIDYNNNSKLDNKDILIIQKTLFTDIDKYHSVFTLLDKDWREIALWVVPIVNS